MDQNFSGSIDFTEFLIAALNEEKLLNKKKMEQAFRMFDAVNIKSIFFILFSKGIHNFYQLYYSLRN